MADAKSKPLFLILDSNEIFAHGLAEQLLEEYTCRITCHTSLRHGEDFLANNKVSLILLAKELVHNNRAVEKLRQHRPAPPILLMGAARKPCLYEACLAKPFSYNRLLETMEGLLTQSAAEKSDHHRIGPWKFIKQERLLKDGKKIHRLTEKEAAICEVLIKNRPRAVLRKTLLQKIWGYDNHIQTRTLETYIYRLRQKIEPVPAKPYLLITTPQGYGLGEKS